MGRHYFDVQTDMNVMGVKWTPGLKEVTDDGWARMLREAGVPVITEREYLDGTSAPAPKKPAAPKPLKGAGNGSADKRGRNQGASAHSG